MSLSTRVWSRSMKCRVSVLVEVWHGLGRVGDEGAPLVLVRAQQHRHRRHLPRLQQLNLCSNSARLLTAVRTNLRTELGVELTGICGRKTPSIAGAHWVVTMLSLWGREQLP